MSLLAKIDLGLDLEPLELDPKLPEIELGLDFALLELAPRLPATDIEPDDESELVPLENVLGLDGDTINPTDCTCEIGT